MYSYAQASSGVGNNVAADVISDVIYQRVKLDYGSEGNSIPATGSALYGLTVDVSRIEDDIQVTQLTSPWVTRINHTVPVSGTVSVGNFPATQAVTQSGSWSFTPIGTGAMAVTNFPAVYPASQSGSWSVTANLAAGTNNIGDVDVLSVPAPLNLTGGGAEANALRVTIASDSTGVVSVDDNGSSLTVDGTVTANQGGAPWAVNMTQVGSTPITTDAGAVDAGTQRVILAVDQTSIPAAQSGTWNVGLNAGSNLIGSVNVANTVAVSGTVNTSMSGTMAVSGTVTALQGGSWTVTSSAGSTTGSLQTMISTELNSLTNTSITTPATTFNNSAGLYRYADFELLVTYGTNPTANSQVELYIVPALDNVNYADGSSTVVSQNNYVGGFLLRAVTTAQRVILREIPLPMCSFKIHVRNSSGQTTAASGNTVRMQPISGVR